MLAQHPSEIALIAGATSPLGRDFVQQLAPYCKSLILVADDGAALAELGASLEHPDRDIHPIVAELSQPLALAEVLEAIRQKGPVSLLINAAGAAHHGDFAHSNVDMQQEMVALHCQCPLVLTRGVLPFMKEAGRGAIINAAAVTGGEAKAGSAVLAASEAFLQVFSQSLELELANEAISVQCLSAEADVSEVVAKALARLSA